MTEIDQTMRNLLAVYRSEVNQLEQERNHWKSQADYRDGVVAERSKMLDQFRDEATKYRNEAGAAKEAVAALEERIAKLEGINQSLKIELADEREAHTTTKDKLAAAVGAEMRGGDQ